MGFTLTWQFLNANTGIPIMGLPINIAHTLTNADCFGSVDYYPETTQDTDSTGSVSQNFGGGMCGSDSISVSSAGTNSYLGTLHKYKVAISSAQTTTYTIYVPMLFNIHAAPFCPRLPINVRPSMTLFASDVCRSGPAKFAILTFLYNM